MTHLEAALPPGAVVTYGPGGHGPAYFSRVAPAEARFIGRAIG